jgi:UDP-N-acetylmuramate dehydrogenase
MKILEHILLAPHTTFNIGGYAHFFCSPTNEDEVRQAVMFTKGKEAIDNVAASPMPFFVLGGGSNILVSDDGFSGLVIQMENKGIEMMEADGKRENGGAGFIVRAAAGENWDDLVQYAVSHGYSGLENLSAIPGTVGAASVQNIGAYGVEASQSISSVRAFDTVKMDFVQFSNADCHFGYRDSIFKHEKGRYIVTRVDFKLEKIDDGGRVNIEYKDLKEFFGKKAEGEKGDDGINGKKMPTPQEVRQAVIDIRSSKLPDLKMWGTAGSFFKNPVVSAEKYDELRKKYPGLPGFSGSDSQGAESKVKISLGWILDHICHAKGLMKGNVGAYEKQALVLVAKLGAGAHAKDVVALADELALKVKEAIGVDIEWEVEEVK